MIGCPPIEEWEALAAGRLEGVAGAALRDHAGACATCSALLAEVNRNERVVGPLRAALAGRFESGTSHVGRRVGKYVITGVLGAGGMATVYEAEQEHPRRLVALKVMGRGLASPSLLSRFRQEAELLGRLHHPGIAQVYEAGVADDGGGGPCPYFAMEIVRGEALTQFAVGHALGTRDRLALLAKVCDAVQHAHEQGVIHRDLKPSNILVDAEGRPKVLDFGIARATDCDVRTTTIRTDVGQIVGTVAYMSPEQAAGEPGAIGARSDVYALGVIGYELLTGRLPHDSRGRPLHEAVRVIREQEPTAISVIDRRLSGDVSTIIATALEKDPSRRYQSAAALGDEIRRFLADQPILARPASTAYQLRKFASRNRVLVGGVAAVFVVLVLGLAGTGYGLWRARREAAFARVAQREAERGHIEADRRRAAAETVTALLERMLGSANPHEVKGLGYTVRQLLDDFARDLGAGLEDQPEVEGALRATVGNAYRLLGEFKAAETHLNTALALRRRAFGAEDAAVAISMADRGWLLHDQADYGASVEAFKEAAAMQRRLPGAGRADLATSLLGLSDSLRHQGAFADARAPGDESLSLRSAALGEEDPDVGECLMNLSKLTRDMGQYDAAEEYLERAVGLWHRAYGEEHPRLVDALNERAWLRYLRRDYAGARDEARHSVEIGRRLLGVAHPDVANGLYQQAMAILNTDPTAGESLMREALSIYRAAHGNEHPSVCTAIDTLARFVRLRGGLDEAEALAREALSLRRAVVGEVSGEVAISLSTLASILKSKGDHEGAEASWREAVSVGTAAHRHDHRDVATFHYNLARLFLDQGKDNEAQAELNEAFRINVAVLGPDHADTVFIESQLAKVYLIRGDFADAEPVLVRAIVLARASPVNWRLGAYLVDLGRCRQGQGRFEEAEAAMKEGVEVLLATLNPSNPEVSAGQRELAALYDAWGRSVEAERVRANISDGAAMK